MGSINKACISGFLCRLCSEMHRTVIHIYGEQGQKHGILEKINGYLPVTISPTDPLPKTICESCLRRVEQHYELLVRISEYRENKGFEKRELRPRVVRVQLNEDDNDSQTATSTVAESQATSSTSTATTTTTGPVARRTRTSTNNSSNSTIPNVSSISSSGIITRTRSQTANSSVNWNSTVSQDDDDGPVTPEEYASY